MITIKSNTYLDMNYEWLSHQKKLIITKALEFWVALIDFENLDCLMMIGETLNWQVTGAPPLPTSEYLRRSGNWVWSRKTIGWQAVLFILTNSQMNRCFSSTLTRSPGHGEWEVLFHDVTFFHLIEFFALIPTLAQLSFRNFGTWLLRLPNLK